ncbi:MAG: hypothetical protein IPN76_12455 [Saprospiraceae bacterium]|nr:hypothetical protein [Saprospiraceae bacterium]
MQLRFDEYGYLVPTEAIKANLEALETTFANNEHRRWLFEKLLSLLEKLILQDIGDHVVLFWVNGSFVTRKELPKDIDIVVFIHHEAFQMHLPILRKLQSQFVGAIDFYFEPSYPVGHKLHPVFEILKNDWLQLYSHTRRHPETMKIHQKGFLEINPDSIF